MTIVQRLRAYVQRNRDYIAAAGTLDIAYFFSCMGDRLWTFSMGFFIMSIGGLAWVALGQMFDSAIKVVTLSYVGQFLDKQSRHFGMQLILACNNLLIFLSALAFYFTMSGYFENSMVLLGVALFFNALSRVASEAQKTAFMKDWIVVIVEESEDGKLSTHNALTNIVDQMAALFSPLICGYAVEKAGPPAACLFFMAWNILSWLVEAFFIRGLYQGHTALQTRDARREEQIEMVEKSMEEEDKTAETPPPAKTNDGSFCSSLSLYRNQSCFRPAFSLALLYLTILGFDNIATSYGYSQGMPPSLVGWFRAAGSIFGVLGLSFYRLFRGAGLSMATLGLIGLVLQNVFLNLSSFSVFVKGNDFDFAGYRANFTGEKWAGELKTAFFEGHKMTGANATIPPVYDIPGLWANAPSLVFFFLGITLARFGLWMADVSIAEIMQETIKEDERYRVNLVQSGLQESFSFAKDVLVLAFPTSATFGCLIIMSVSSVFCGFLLYTSWFIPTKCPCRKSARTLPAADSSRGQVENGYRPASPLGLKGPEPGCHPELEELLYSDGIEASLQTNRTDAL